MMIRQGDILIKKIDKMPEGLPEIPREGGKLILAYGEVTGHCHYIDDPLARMYGTNGSDLTGPKYIHIERPSSPLIHDEHYQYGLAAGDHVVTRQREYAPDEIKPVRD